MNIDNLTCRHWRSEHIRAYCLVLARCDSPVLASLEPLHTIREDSPEGALLWAAYCAACELPDVAEQAMELARARWPEDGRLRDFILQLKMRL